MTDICAHCPPALAVPAAELFRLTPVCARCAWRLAQLAMMTNEPVWTLADVIEIGACVVVLSPDVYNGARGRLMGRISFDVLTVHLAPPVFATVIVEARYVQRAECAPAPVKIGAVTHEPMWRE